MLRVVTVGNEYEVEHLLKSRDEVNLLHFGHIARDVYRLT